MLFRSQGDAGGKAVAAALQVDGRAALGGGSAPRGACAGVTQKRGRDIGEGGTDQRNGGFAFCVLRARRACVTRNRRLLYQKTLVMNKGRPGGKSLNKSLHE